MFRLVEKPCHHLHSAINFCKISIGHHLWGLVANTNFESSRAPVDELDGTFGLERSNGYMYVLWYNITPVEQASSHVFPVARIALHHLVVGLEARHRDLLDRIGLVRGLGRRDDWRVCDEWEVDTGVWH